MGLCKCPKRKVTNQFCFEHRVCVCEHCMITNHPTCVVQSYLQWLQDSDYNSTCELCSKELTTDDSIRLTCYHIFHWSCLDHYSRQLPPTTAPGGYLCPSEGCKTPLFPTPNLVSPIADVLKEKLAGVNWARSGLGLPLLSEEREVKKSISTQNSKMIKPPQANSNMNGPPNTHSVVNVDEENQAFNRNTDHDMYQSNSSNRRFQEQRDVNKYVQFDHDDDKYKRRPVPELMRNWWRLGSNTRGPQSLIKKYLMLGFIILFAVVIVLMFLSKMSKTSDYDPTYDEFQQQFVRVNDKS